MKKMPQAIITSRRVNAVPEREMVKDDRQRLTGDASRVLRELFSLDTRHSTSATLAALVFI
jgi:hypothetical protein